MFPDLFGRDVNAGDFIVYPTYSGSVKGKLNSLSIGVVAEETEKGFLCLPFLAGEDTELRRKAHIVSDRSWRCVRLPGAFVPVVASPTGVVGVCHEGKDCAGQELRVGDRIVYSSWDPILTSYFMQVGVIMWQSDHSWRVLQLPTDKVFDPRQVNLRSNRAILKYNGFETGTRSLDVQIAIASEVARGRFGKISSKETIRAVDVLLRSRGEQPLIYEPA